MIRLLGFLLLFSVGFLSAAEPVLPKNYLPLPLVRQETDFSCGPAAYLSILRYWDLFSGTEEDLYPILKTTQANGTNPRNIMKAANEMGLTARLEEKVTIEKLNEAWAKGETVILDLQAWREDPSKPWKDLWSEGHYIVLIGMDPEYLYAMDPSVSRRYGYLPLNELYERWHDFEVEEGKEWRNFQLAIFMKGKVPGNPFPAPEALVRIN